MMPHSYGTWCPLEAGLPRVIASEAEQSSHLLLTGFRRTWRRLLRRFSPRNDAEARGVIYDAPYSSASAEKDTSGRRQLDHSDVHEAVGVTQPVLEHEQGP